jgi:cytochrome c-type biogenesis protein
MSVTSLISSGPLLLAMPVAAAAGAVTFLSPCCLPLVPGYLAYITGMSGADSYARRGSANAAANSTAAGSSGTASAAAGMAADGVGGSGTATVTAAPATAPSGPAGARRGQMVAGTALFVLGFSLVFCLIGMAAGGVGELLQAHTAGITRVLGGVTILLGLMFFGAFDRFMFAGRVFKPSFMPKAGLAGAPLLGVLFGVSWTPCIGPTLMAVDGLSLSSGTAARGAFLAFIYGLGLGIPFLLVAAMFQRAMNFLAFFKRNARLVTRIGGVMLIALGVVEVTGAWTSVIAWLHAHWFSGYNTPL